MNIDNSFKFIPLKEESSSCEVVRPKNIKAPRKAPKPTAKTKHTDIPKKSHLTDILIPAGAAAAIGLGLFAAPEVTVPLLLSVGTAATLPGCLDMSPKPKIIRQPNYVDYPGYYPNNPLNTGTGGSNPPPSSNIPTQTQTPAPSLTPGPIITPSPGAVPDNSLEFDPANLEVSNIDSIKLQQIKNETASMSNVYDASNFFNKYKVLLDHLIKEKSVMEGFQKALRLCGSSASNELEISKALVNYYLKYNYLIEEPSSNTLNWQIFESSFESLKKRSPQDANDIINNFIKFSVSNNYSSLHVLEKLLEKYISLLEQTGNTDKFLNKTNYELFFILNYENAPLKKSDLARANVQTLLACIYILPNEFYSGLKKINLAITEDGHSHYRSSPEDQIIELNPQSAGRSIHETGHHYSINTAPARLIQLYYQISWNEQGRIASQDNNDFASQYGGTDKLEDFAEFLDKYVYEGFALRSKIRSQLTAGKFELAAKYLFIKYFTPFKGKEFYTDVNPPLRAKEVADAIARAGNNASPQVMAIVNSIVSSGK